jgi:hypothetical protein
MMVMMASINWYWFIVIGVAVTAISSFTPRLLAFVVPGAFFIIYGLGKFAVIIKTNKKKSKSREQDSPYNHSPQDRSYHHDLHMHKNHARQVPNYRFCPNCGTRLRLQDNFCSSCGARLPGVRQRQNHPLRAHDAHS